MKRSSLFMALNLMLILSFGMAHGQTASVYVSGISGTIGTDGPDADAFPDTLRTGQPIVFTIAYANNTGTQMIGGTNGFVLYSPDGAAWSDLLIDTLNIAPTTGAGWKARFDLVFGFSSAVTDGASPDTVGVGGITLTGPGLPTGFDFNVATISIPAPGIDSTNAGKSICLDSARYDPALNEWLWSTTGGGVAPAWAGPHCFIVDAGIASGIDESDLSNIPTSFELEQNFPNPFNPTTSIKFGLPTKSHVSITVYNLLGQEITSLVNEELSAGTHTTEWNGRDKSNTEVASGIYFYKLIAGDFVDTKKMMLVK